MKRLSRDPKIVQLAKELDLDTSGDCVAVLRDYALAQVSAVYKEFKPDSLGELLSALNAKFDVRLEQLHSNDDIDRIASEYASFDERLGKILKKDFFDDRTEGLLLRHPCPLDGERDYLAVIDARGSQRWRWFFTAVHEVVHRILRPPTQLSLEFCRRAPTRDQIRKDPEESVVDHIAGFVAFYEPIFGPALRHAADQRGCLTLEAIEEARLAVGSDASFQAAAMAAVRLSDAAACFVKVDFGLKAAEKRLLACKSDSPSNGWAGPKAKLRVQHPFKNDGGDEVIGLFNNMRVPPGSVLKDAYEDELGVEFSAREDLSWWETSERGFLKEQPLKVHAMRRGSFVYGLLVAS